MTKAVQHEPCGSLRDFQVVRELRVGDALAIRGDDSSSKHPLAKADFAVLEDGSNFDRKAFAALTAFVGAAVGEVVDCALLI